MLATAMQFPFLGFFGSSAAFGEFASDEEKAAFETLNKRHTEELRASGGVTFERPDMLLIGALNTDRAQKEREASLDEKIHTFHGQVTRRDFLAGKFEARPRQMEILAGPMSAADLELSRARCKTDGIAIRNYLESRNKLMTAHIEAQAQ